MSESLVASPEKQKFNFGFEVIMWDLGGYPVDGALKLIAAEGYGWFEALLGNTLGADFSRRVMTLGPRNLPEVVSDVRMFDRLAYFGRAEAEYGPKLASLFCDGEWLNPNVWPHEFATAQVLTRFLHSCGAPVFVIGGGPPATLEAHSTDTYREFADKLAQIGRYTADFGIRSVYHPHIDTFIETREQLDQLMDVLDTDVVGLCIDPAHLQEKLSDPVDIFKTYASQINYVHLKDCTGDETTLSGFDRYLAFAPLGTGIIDIPGIINALIAADYDGLIIVEQDISEQPDQDFLTGTKYIRETLGLKLAVD